MKLLLDTCTFLWLALDSPELTPRARQLFQSIENEVYLSAVSGWEICIKHSLGRLPLPKSPERFIPEIRKKMGIEFLAIQEEAALHLVRLPYLHRDPFDRMLVCQAIVHSMTILSPDEEIRQYAVKTEW